MKIVKKPIAAEDEKLSFTLRLRRELIKQLDQVAHKNNLSRQKLLESIIEQSFKDKNFVLELS